MSGQYIGSVGLGFAAYGAIAASGALKEVAKFAKATTPPESLNRYFTGIKGVDRFLSVIIPFFRAALDDQATRLLMSTFCGVGLAAFAKMGVEGLRVGAATLHYLYPPTALVTQVLGICFSVPTMFVTAWIGNNTAPAPPSSTSGVLLLAAGLVATALPVFGLLLYPEPARGSAIAWFQISPVLGWLVWGSAPLIGSAIDQALPDLVSLLPPRDAAKYLFITAAGVSFVGHIQFLVETYGHRGLLSRVFGLLKRQTGGRAAGHFLAIDFVGLYAALLYLVYLESGKTAALRALALSPIVGPGAALAFAFAGREGQLGGF